MTVSTGELVGLLGLPAGWDEDTAAGAVRRVGSPRFRRWEQQVRGCGYCARPVRLKGRVTRGQADGSRDTYSTAGEPDGVLLVRCGNRRAAVCPSCSREYKGDMWHLLSAGVAGGSKGVPQEVASRALVFATLTAPGFGPVHTTRRDRNGGPARCRPRTGKDRALCPHGRPAWCMAVHSEGAGHDRLGQPLCIDCFDYAGVVWFNLHAPELWRRLIIYLPRCLARQLGVSERRLRELVRVQYAKVAEFQRRGVVHFHVILRLDGSGPGYPAPRINVPADLLAEAVRDAAGLVAVRVPAWQADRPGVVLRFGRQVDARPVRHRGDLDDGDVTPEKVAAYIAKYATKAAEDFGLAERLRRPEELDYRRLPVTAHVRRLVETVHELAGVEPRLGRWLHMLGFPGHFATKSRAFSTTLGAIRGERRAHRQRRERGDRGPVEPAGHDEPDLADGEETTLVLACWEFAGLGYTTAGDAALAASAAARAREHAGGSPRPRRRAVGRRSGADRSWASFPIASLLRPELVGSRGERSEIA